MNIYAISDLHLSGEPAKKPMDIFGEHWTAHKEKVKENWLATVKEEDTVIICGDISWAMQLREVEEDLMWIAQLPGRKILMRGNHDYWWTSLKKMQDNFGKHFEFLQNNCIMVGDTAICGTRGWLLPSSENFTEDDNKIYQREGIRLEMSLQAFRSHRANSFHGLNGKIRSKGLRLRTHPRRKSLICFRRRTQRSAIQTCFLRYPRLQII